jgi:hypothetical protein
MTTKLIGRGANQVPVNGMLGGMAYQEPNAVNISGGKISALTPGSLTDYADDTAAATGGIAVGGLYRTGSAIKIRVA